MHNVLGGNVLITRLVSVAICLFDRLQVSNFLQCDIDGISDLCSR